MKKQKFIIMLAGKRRAGKDYFADQIITSMKQTYYETPSRLYFARLIKQYLSEFTTYSIEELDNMKNNEEDMLINYDSFVKKFKDRLISMQLKGKLCRTSKQEFEKNLNNFDYESVLSNTNYIYTNDRKFIRTDVRIAMQKVGESFKTICQNPEIWGELLIEDLMKRTPESVIITDFRYQTEFNIISEYAKKKDFKLVTVMIHGQEKEKDDKYDNHISENDLNHFDFDIIIDNTNHANQQELFDSAINVFEIASGKEN